MNATFEEALIAEAREHGAELDDSAVARLLQRGDVQYARQEYEKREIAAPVSQQ